MNFIRYVLAYFRPKYPKPQHKEIQIPTRIFSEGLNKRWVPSTPELKSHMDRILSNRGKI